MAEPKWLVEARRYIGEREIKGPKHNPKILQMWKDIKRGGIKDDETPWCAAFVGAGSGASTDHVDAIRIREIVSELGLKTG